MLIINGQVFHERDKLSPKLTLVQIKLKAAVLEFKGYRYSISY
jgi:general secretion pathway protein B